MYEPRTISARGLGVAFVRTVSAGVILAVVLAGSGFVALTVSPSAIPFAFRSELVDQGPSPTLAPGATTSYTVRVRNTGLAPWQRGTDRQVALGVSSDSTKFADDGMAVSWLKPNRLAATAENLVLPGMIGTFTFTVRAPTTPGVYRIPMRPVVDGVTWLQDEPIVLVLTSDLGFHSQLVGQSGHPTLRPGDVISMTVTLRNTGAKTWVRGSPNQQVNLGVANDDKAQTNLGFGWPTKDRVAMQLEPIVGPGSVGTFTFKVKAPPTPGIYVLRLRPVADGVTWLEDDGIMSLITVVGASGTPEKIEVSARPNQGVPSFTLSGYADPVNANQGGAVVLRGSFAAAVAATAVVGMEVYAPGGSTLVYQRWFDGEHFGAGDTQTYATTWQVPSSATLGSYTVTLRVFSPGWKTLYSSKSEAASFNVAAAPVAAAPPALQATPTAAPTVAPAASATVAPPVQTNPTGTVAPPPSSATPGPTATIAPTIAPTAAPTATVAPSATATAAPPGPISFVTAASAAPMSVPAGGSTNLTALVTSATATSGIVVDIEVYSGSGAQLYQVWFENQNFSAGQQLSYPATWQVPLGTANGTYDVKVGVFSQGWTTLYTWNNSAAAVMVTAAAPSPTATPVGTPVGTPIATVPPTPAPTFTPGPTAAPGTLIPPDRMTSWSAGIQGGVPARTTVCANLSASTYGNGTQEASAGIQAALDACPAGQVVQLSAGNFRVNNFLLIHSGITLRGAGLGATTLTKTNGARARLSPTQPVDPSTYSYDTQPIIIVGPGRWPSMDNATSQGLTVDGAQGARTVTVANAAGFAPGQIVLVDELSGASWQNTPSGFPGAAKVWAGDRVAWNMHWPLQQWQDDNSFSDANGPYDMDGGTRVVPHAMSWFSRQDRPTNEMKDIASVSGNTITFTTPLTISYRTNHGAQVTRATTYPHVRNAGVEDLSTVGGADGQVRFENAAYSWAKNIEVTQWIGEGVAINSSFRVELRDSYIHTGSWPTPGGAGYALSFADGSSNVLVENNILIDTNKVMVMRSSGAGSVVGYNYADDGWISYDQGWQEVGINASHMSGPHHVLFEGNYSQNADSDYTHGNAIYLTFYRNLLTGHRRTFTDVSNVRAAGLAYGSWWDSFVGNVLGLPGQMSGWVYEDPSMTSNTASWTDRSIWKLGYDPERWSMVPDPKVLSTVIREGNFDYVTNQVHWSGAAQTLPASLYLGGKPAFFGNNPWPWVDPTGATKLFTLPAKARYDAMPGH